MCPSELTKNRQNVKYTVFEFYKYSDTLKKGNYKDICNAAGLEYDIARNLTKEQVLNYVGNSKQMSVQ